MSVMKRLQKYIKNKDKKSNVKKKMVIKKTTKPVVWRNSKRVGRTKVASKLRTEYNPGTDQWIKYTD